MNTGYLWIDTHVPERARFPVIDAHNHLWGKWETLDNVVHVMDAVGVAAYCDLTANVALAWGDGGYMLSQGDLDHFLTNCRGRFPGRFYGFTTLTFAQPPRQPLFTDAGEFVERTVALLRDHVARGARGVKILKELGLHYRDSQGTLINCDDARLTPVWTEAGRLGVPVLIHQADPYGFFQSATPDNEHYTTLRKYPAWSFGDRSRFPSFEDLQARYRRLIERNPGTTFMLPHVANWPENLRYVARLLDDCPNTFVDFSARIDELGRQPYTARDFFMRYADRLYFGSDMPASADMYRCYFRFLETRDEWFAPPDYDGTFARERWRICGLALPDDVLRKVYHENALRLIPNLERDVRL